MASEPLPHSHVDLPDGFVLCEESLMHLDDDGTRWTETVIGHVDLPTAQAALDAAGIDSTATTVRHAWIQINRHQPGCDYPQDELQNGFAESLDWDTSRGRCTAAGAELTRAAARDDACGCNHDAEAHRGVDWWIRPATSRDLHAIPVTSIGEAAELTSVL